MSLLDAAVLLNKTRSSPSSIYRSINLARRWLTNRGCGEALDEGDRLISLLYRLIEEDEFQSCEHEIDYSVERASILRARDCMNRAAFTNRAADASKLLDLLEYLLDDHERRSNRC